MELVDLAGVNAHFDMGSGPSGLETEGYATDLGERWTIRTDGAEMHISLRPAIHSDAAYLLRLEETCMRGYAEALWGTWKPSATVDAFDPANHYIVERDGVPVGCVAEVWQPDHLFIGKLYLDGPFQRQGIGAIVLEMKVAEAVARGIPVKLSVLTTNPADAFYRREGFEVEAETAERRTMSKWSASTAASDSATSGF